MKTVKQFFRTNLYTKNLYENLHDLKIEKKRMVLRKQGPHILFWLDHILTKSNCLFFFDMGTLLGIIREGKLLSHDLDIDIAIYASDEERQDNIRKLLREEGCTLLKSFFVDGVGRTEDSFCYKGIKFDINYYYRFDDKEDTCFLFAPYNEEEEISNTFTVLALKCSSIESTKKISFYHHEVTVPANPEKYLEERYGYSWKIPDKNYKYWKGPSVHTYNENGHVQHA